MGDITLPSGDYVENKNYGADLELSALTIDRKGRKAVVIYETRKADGTWTGARVTATVTDDGATLVTLGGKTRLFPKITYDVVKQSGLVDTAPIHAFIVSKGGDLTES